MDGRYEHTQTGTVTIVAVGAPAVVSGVAAVVTRQPALAIVAVLLLVVLSQFSTLTTRVADGVLDVRMGRGPLRRHIDLRDVERVEIAHHLWMWGWGIRWTPRGWLWNVSGTRGVDLHFRNGKRFRIGSDEPEKLAAAIRSWLGGR
jgi:hypothetical protein